MYSAAVMQDICIYRSGGVVKIKKGVQFVHFIAMIIILMEEHGIIIIS